MRACAMVKQSKASLNLRGDERAALPVGQPVDRADIGALAQPEADEMRRMLFRLGAEPRIMPCGLSNGRIAVPPGSSPSKISPFASAITSLPKYSICAGAMVVTIATCGRTMRGQRGQLARMVHVHLEHAIIGGRGHARLDSAARRHGCYSS